MRAISLKRDHQLNLFQVLANDRGVTRLENALLLILILIISFIIMFSVRSSTRNSYKSVNAGTGGGSGSGDNVRQNDQNKAIGKGRHCNRIGCSRLIEGVGGRNTDKKD